MNNDDTVLIAVRTDKGEAQVHQVYDEVPLPDSYDALCDLVRRHLPEAKTILVRVK